MAKKWYAGFQNGTIWVPNPESPGFDNEHDVRAWAAAWAKQNPSKPAPIVGSLDHLDA